MNHSLDHRTIVIVEGRSISTFRLRKALEKDGAAVCITSKRDAAVALHQAKPDAVVIDFSLASDCEELCAELERDAVTYLYCSSPNRQQDYSAQVLAAQDVAAALAEVVNHYEAAMPGLPNFGREIDPELYAI